MNPVSSQKPSLQSNSLGNAHQKNKKKNGNFRSLYSDSHPNIGCSSMNYPMNARIAPLTPCVSFYESSFFGFESSYLLMC